MQNNKAEKDLIFQILRAIYKDETIPIFDKGMILQLVFHRIYHELKSSETND